jgi:DNA-binding response OmpR family regulator
MKILVVDDDIKILELIFDAFEVAWPEAIIFKANSGLEALKLLTTEDPDIILLDLGLPDISGFDVAKKIRQTHNTPIIIITAREEETDIVKALNLGADEYLVKPFGQMELVARIKALTRRISPKEQEIISFRSLKLIPSSNELKYKDNIIRLSNTERVILYHLLKAKGQVVTNSELAILLFGPNISGSENMIKAYIYRLRQKIEDDYHKPSIILTQSGAGYYLSSDL